MDVARVALALVELGHERERLALQERDLLGAVAVDDVVVGHAQRLLVAEVDLVLAEVALALGVLDEHARARHAEPDRAHDRLDHRRAEDRVVDVVGVGGPQVAPALGARRLVGLVEEDELELGARVGRPAALGEALELAAQHLARRGGDGRAVVPEQVALHHDGALEPRDAPQRREVGHEDEVAVAALPRRHRVARHRVHVDVDREQVVAALGAVLGDAVDERAGGQPLALQAALHVAHRDDDGVDPAARDLGVQLLQRQHARRVRHARRAALTRGSGPGLRPG